MKTLLFYFALHCALICCDAVVSYGLFRSPLMKRDQQGALSDMIQYGNNSIITGNALVGRSLNFLQRRACDAGYYSCGDGYCCPTGETCIGGGYCCLNGNAPCGDGYCYDTATEICCSDGSNCPKGYNCVEGGCCPAGEKRCGNSKCYNPKIQICCTSPGYAWGCETGSKCCSLGGATSCVEPNTEQCCPGGTCDSDYTCCGQECCSSIATCGSDGYCTRKADAVPSPTSAVSSAAATTARRTTTASDPDETDEPEEPEAPEQVQSSTTSSATTTPRRTTTSPLGAQTASNPTVTVTQVSDAMGWRPRGNTALAGTFVTLVLWFF